MDDFGTGNTQGTLIDTDSIGTVPVTAFLATFDGVCPSSIAEDYLDRMATSVKKHYFHGKYHAYFDTFNSNDYFDLIECELSTEDQPSTCFGCYLQDRRFLLSAIVAVAFAMSF